MQRDHALFAYLALRDGKFLSAFLATEMRRVRHSGLVNDVE